MNERSRAQLRLLLLQSAWSYERMHGIGMGYAAEPLLGDLETLDPRRLAEARVRAAEPFNAHPVLAGVALGASVRAEMDGVPGTQVSRLKAALGGPLGALGDQLFWAGIVPFLSGLGLILVVRGWVVGGLLLLVGGYNACRWATARWALRLGMANGMTVGTALGTSWLPRTAPAVGPAAGTAVALALPLVLAWYARPALAADGPMIGGIALLVALVSWRFQREVPPVRVALVLVAIVLLVRLGGA
jgi:PTS system mannose-specific IID component